MCTGVLVSGHKSSVSALQSAVVAAVQAEGENSLIGLEISTRHQVHYLPLTKPPYSLFQQFGVTSVPNIVSTRITFTFPPSYLLVRSFGLLTDGEAFTCIKVSACEPTKLCFSFCCCLVYKVVPSWTQRSGVDTEFSCRGTVG